MPESTYYQRSTAEILKALKTSTSGLSNVEAAKRLQAYGPNEITAKEQNTWWSILLGQFKNFFIFLLLAAGLFSWLVGDRLETVIIVLVVLVNVIIGFIQEFKAEKALEALKKMFVTQVTVIRGGKKQRLNRTDLVPGDIVLLETGDKVPADLRLINVTALKIDESILTGESSPVTKTIDVLAGDHEVADQVNMAFTGTLVVYGKGTGVVVATGDTTEFGKIAHLVSEEEEPTPLEERLHTIGQWFTYIAIAIGLVVFALGVMRGQDILKTFEFVIALLVAAVPESLPVVLTLALAFGAVRLAKRKSIIRRLPVVETLGDVDIIASDKTGTLTKNEMTVTHVIVTTKQGLAESAISGVGYTSNGSLSNTAVAKEQSFDCLIKTGIYVNESSINHANLGDSPLVEKGSRGQSPMGRNFSIVGDPTEAALLIMAEKVGYSVDTLESGVKRLDEIQFDPKQKFMATLNQSRQGMMVSVKGAPEVVLEMCSIDARLKKQLLKKIDDLANQGLRTLGFAGTSVSKALKNIKPENLKNLTFYGLVGMLDPVREGIKEALAITERAGIRTIMVTGDHALTAQAIARQLGMKQTDALTGKDLATMSDQALLKKLETVTIFARTAPEDKLRIVKLLEEKGQHIVAVTGDGVNDAPALKAAQVGVAMGLRGTDVTRETADMILMDDSFATIVKSVEMGRGIFDNVKKFIILLLSGNIVEVLVVALTSLLALPSPFTTIQVLWINLVTDSFPALALGFDPPKPNILRDRPEMRNRGIVQVILRRSFLMALVGFVLAFAIYLISLQSGVLHARTMTFTFVVFFELVTVFGLEDDRPIWEAMPRPSILVIGAVLLSVILQLVAIYGPGERIFETSELVGSDWLILVSSLVAYYLIADLIKKYTSRIQK